MAAVVGAGDGGSFSWTTGNPTLGKVIDAHTKIVQVTDARGATRNQTSLDVIGTAALQLQGRLDTVTGQLGTATDQANALAQALGRAFTTQASIAANSPGGSVYRSQVPVR